MPHTQRNPAFSNFFTGMNELVSCLTSYKHEWSHFSDSEGHFLMMKQVINSFLPPWKSNVTLQSAHLLVEKYLNFNDPHQKLYIHSSQKIIRWHFQLCDMQREGSSPCDWTCPPSILCTLCVSRRVTYTFLYFLCEWCLLWYIVSSFLT